jgi:Ser/Thr protein kinase RdoA (MazF antagonist)
MNKITKLTNIIKSQYGIACISAEERLGGWSAMAYRISDGVDQYFLKVYDKNRASTQKLTAMIDVYIPILLRLNENERLSGKLPVPLLTKTKQAKFEDEDGVYLLYRYIDGETVGNKVLTDHQTEQLAEIIASLHSFNLDSFPMNTANLIEDFSLPFLDSLKSILFADPASIPNDLWKLLNKSKHALLKLINTTQELSASLRLNQPP